MARGKKSLATTAVDHMNYDNIINIFAKQNRVIIHVAASSTTRVYYLHIIS
jgi:hypothetical protein